MPEPPAHPPFDPETMIRPAVQRWGIVVTNLSAIREIPIEIDSERLMRAVRLLHPYRDGAPRVRLDEDEVSWRDRRGLTFAVTSRAGATEIRVFVSKVMIRRARWTGWVKAAADRLEALVLLLAAQDDARGGRPGLPPPQGPQASA